MKHSPMKHSQQQPHGSRARAERGPWKLTQEAFRRLLEFLDDDPQRAGATYEAVYRRLVRIFVWRGCEFPEELADETLNRVARKLEEGEEIATDEPFRYISGVARLIFHEALRRRERQRAALRRRGRSPAAVIPNPEDEEEAAIRLRCLRQELRRLPADKRRLILLYYEGEKGEKIARRRRLAGELGIPLNALRIRAHRIRVHLEAAVAECLKRNRAPAHSSAEGHRTDG